MSFTRQQVGWYGLFALVFVSHQLLEGQGIHVRLLDNYLDVFLFPILALPLVLQEKRMLLNDNAYRFSPVILLAYCAMLVVVSEFVFPWLSSRFFFDPIDIVMIGLGTVVFAAIFNRLHKT